jgi:mannose-6-phosphate isomerase class I
MTTGSPTQLDDHRTSKYDRFPAVAAGSPADCAVGWDAIAAEIRRCGGRVVVIDAYVGVRYEELRTLVDRLDADLVVCADDALLPGREIERLTNDDVTHDPVFGRLTGLTMLDLFGRAALARLRRAVDNAPGTVVVYGTGAGLIADGDVLIVADMPRREGQLRQRRDEVANLGLDNRTEDAATQYKRSFFVDWRVCDAHKLRLFGRADFLLDTCSAVAPKLANGAVIRRALNTMTSRPFRVVPWFDPAPWGGQWLRRVCDLDADEVNYGWAFDCVPEENSLLLRFGDVCFETPALNLVRHEPVGLLGSDIVERFGAEFPIRFDFLDTMGGGNLSLQVHPLTEYIHRQFGMSYTQDESYYLLDAAPEANVYLGLRTGIDRDQMLADLRRAERGDDRFPDEHYVNRLPARKHDHFLIPAGTVHCSGANCVVLEISATPYVFTFKLWDWGRPGLYGRPRPLHIDHGERSIQWERDTEFVRRHLVNCVEPIAAGDGWREERTGLHEREFIETRRHWFTNTVPHDTDGRLNVLNLVEGDEAVVESPDGAFDPFPVHYAETFIVPAAAGPYTIRPSGTSTKAAPQATIKAIVRRVTQPPPSPR